MSSNEVYTFQKDISMLRYLTDSLVKDTTPKTTDRCVSKMKAILDRIQQNRADSYVPYEVKQYFREDE